MKTQPVEFLIESKAFLRAAEHALPLCGGRTLPILTTFRFEVGGDSVGLTASNLEARVTSISAAEVVAPGSFCLPARRLVDIAKRINADKLIFRMDKEKIYVGDGNGSSLLLPFLPADEFPPEPPQGDSTGADFEKGVLSKALRRVIPFASDDATRYVLNSVILHGDGEALEMCSTSGNYLRLTALPRALKCWAFVPIEAARSIASLSEDVACRIAINEGSITFMADGLRFTSKLIEHNHGGPEFYRQVIPSGKAHEQSIEAPREELISCASLAAVVAGEPPFIVLESEEGKLVLSGRSAENGSSKVSVADSSCSLKASICLKAPFLIDALRSFDAPRVTLLVENPMSPVMIRDDTGTVVLMPARIG